MFAGANQEGIASVVPRPEFSSPLLAAPSPSALSPIRLLLSLTDDTRQPSFSFSGHLIQPLQTRCRRRVVHVDFPASCWFW